MKTFATLAAAAVLFSTSYAATVKIEETPCIQNNTELQTFEVEIGEPRVGGKLYPLPFSSLIHVLTPCPRNRVSLWPQNRLCDRRRHQRRLVPGLQRRRGQKPRLRSFHFQEARSHCYQSRPRRIHQLQSYRRRQRRRLHYHHHPPHRWPDWYRLPHAIGRKLYRRPDWHTHPALLAVWLKHRCAGEPEQCRTYGLEHWCVGCRCGRAGAIRLN